MVWIVDGREPQTAWIASGIHTTAELFFERRLARRLDSPAWAPRHRCSSFGLSVFCQRGRKGLGGFIVRSTTPQPNPAWLRVLRSISGSCFG